MNVFETWVTNMWGETIRVYKGSDWNSMMHAAEPYQGGWKDVYYKVTFTNEGYEIWGF